MSSSNSSVFRFGSVILCCVWLVSHFGEIISTKEKMKNTAVKIEKSMDCLITLFRYKEI